MVYIVKSNYPLNICHVCSYHSEEDVIPVTIANYGTGIYELCLGCMKEVFDMNENDIDTYSDAYEYETTLPTPLVPTQKWLEFERQRIKSMLNHLNKQLSVIESKPTTYHTCPKGSIWPDKFPEHENQCCRK
jgi:hypothetical protein